MHIVVVGTDYHLAPVEVRERLAFRASDLPRALQELTSAESMGDGVLQEAVILTTCNRVEVYGVTTDPSQAERGVSGWLHSFHGLAPDTHHQLLHTLRDSEAVHHLFATTCGLNSMIVGEPQIQGQVRAAYQVAAEARTSGPILHALFRHALETGKRVRTETGIDRTAVSVSQAGVELARRLLGSLATARVLLVGSGKMSELAAKNLLDNGARSIVMVNRTVERAQHVARAWGGEVLGWDYLPSALLHADVVLTSTAAPHTVIQADHIRAAVAGRTTPLILIDLAVPRDIDPDVALVPGAHLYNIDDLEQVVATNLARRRDEIADVAQIVAEEGERFAQWLSTRAVVPTLLGLREQAEDIRKRELERALKRLGPLEERERQIIEALSANIVNKLLHRPTVRLKNAAARGDGLEYAAALQTLFGLGGGEPTP